MFKVIGIIVAIAISISLMAGHTRSDGYNSQVHYKNDGLGGWYADD